MPAEPTTKVPKEAPALPREAWLKKHANYQRVYREGRRQSLPLMTYFYALRGRDSNSAVSTKERSSPDDLALRERAHLGSRVGLTAGRVLGNAVERNRIKRRMRAAVRQHRLELTASVDIILHPRRTVLEAEFAAIEGEVREALRTVQAAAETAERTGCELPGKPPRERAKPKAASGKDGEAKEPSTSRGKISARPGAKSAAGNSRHAN